MSRYLVTGMHKYRDHATGEEFEATLEPDVEARAIARGAIKLLERSDVKLDPAGAKPPRKPKT